MLHNQTAKPMNPNTIIMHKEKPQAKHTADNGNVCLSVDGRTCVPEYEVSKREILRNLRMAHEDLTKRKYKSAKISIGIMIRMLEREMGI